MTYIDLLPPAKSGSRGLTWEPAAADHPPACGTLTVDTKAGRAVYRVEEFPTGWRGRGFALKKADGSGHYCVFCSADGPEADSCDCPAASWGNNGCRHVGAIRTLVGNGWL